MKSRILNSAELSTKHDIDINNFLFNSYQNGITLDQIGRNFEMSLEFWERKQKGQYYTPKTIVEYMVSQLDIKPDSKIIDPACGCGSFLIYVFEIFSKKYGNDFIRNIYGVDINEDAVKMTRACLSLLTGFDEKYKSILTNNIRVGNSLLHRDIFNEHCFDLEVFSHSSKKSEDFDIVIGNPPYVTLKKYNDYDPNDQIYSKIINGPVNAASLMIIRSLEMLRENGILSFLLPKSILYVDSYDLLRQYITENTELLEIYDLGSKFKDVRGEQIILFIKKISPSEKSGLRIKVFADKSKNLNDQETLYFDQNEYAKFKKFFSFNNREYYLLLDKIEKKGISLNEYVRGKIFRGLSLSRDKLIKGSKNKIVRGKDIRKFKIESVYAISDDTLSLQSKVKIGLLKNKKIVAQNIFSSESGIISAYDSDGALTLDTVTNIIVNSYLQGKYILGLLNSKLMNFFVTFSIFNRSRLTMHLDKSYIGLIPVAKNPTKLDDLIKTVDLLEKTTEIAMEKEYLRVLDKIVYDIYGLSEAEINIIEKAMSETLSKKSMW